MQSEDGCNTDAQPAMQAIKIGDIVLKMESEHCHQSNYGADECDQVQTEMYTLVYLVTIRRRDVY